MGDYDSIDITKRAVVVEDAGYLPIKGLQAVQHYPGVAATAVKEHLFQAWLPVNFSIVTLFSEWMPSARHTFRTVSQRIQRSSRKDK